MIVQKYKFHIYLLVLVLISYWPFTFFQCSLLNDDIDVALATKYYAGSCLQNGLLPLWNPYQIFGFPAHADLQYTNWNLEVMLVGIIKGYDYTTLHIIYLIYLYFGAIGMFLLGKYLTKANWIGFYIGTVYILCGLYTAHTQSLVTILGLVWLPYVILYFLKWIEAPNLQSSSLVSIFFYLFFTHGYQAFAFMLLPIMLCLVVLKLVDIVKQKQIHQLKQHIAWGVAVVMFIAILLSPVFISQLESKPFVERLSGLSIEASMFNPFSPYCFISAINPILSIGHDELFNTDVTMRNIYIGIMPVMLLLISVFKKNKTIFEYVLLLFSVLYFFASFGDYTPVRKILYYSFPGFNLFRFPSLIRVIAVICLLIYLAKNLKFSLNLFFKNIKLRKGLIAIFFCCSSIITLFCFFKIKTFDFTNVQADSIIERITKCSSYEISFYFGVFQLFCLLLSFIILNKNVAFKSFFKRVFIITFVDLSFTILIYGPFVAFSTIKPALFQSNFNKLPTNFQEPSKDPSIDNLAKYEHITKFWKNTGCFKKQAMPYDEWTSFLFSNYNSLADHYPFLKDSLHSYPFIYFSKPLKKELVITSKIDTSFRSIKNSFHYKNAHAEYRYLRYNPHQLLIECEASENLILNLQQSYYTGWIVKIDGHESSLLWNASLLMSAPVSKGKHIIEFNYSNQYFVYALIISYGFLCLLVVSLMLKKTPYKSSKTYLRLLFLMSVAILIYLFYNNSKKHTMTKNDFTFVGLQPKIFHFNLNNKQDYKNLWDTCELYRPNAIIYSWENYYNTPEFLHALNYHDINPLSVNSGSIIIHYKTSDEVLFSEKYHTHRSNKQFLDSTYSNDCLEFESKKNPYVANHAINLVKLKCKNLYGFVTLKSEKGAEPIVVCAIKHKGGEEEQKYFPLNKYLIPDNSQQKIPYYFDIKHVVREGDDIQLFLMNQSEIPACLKEFSGTCH